RVLSTARCILWKAQVTNQAPVTYGKYHWKFESFSFDAQERIFGIKRPPGLDPGWFWGPHLPREQLDRMTVVSNHALANGLKGYQQDFEIIDGHGERRFLHEDVHITPLRPNEWELIGVTVDITERKRAEQALRDSGDRLSLLIEHMDAIYVHDYEGRFVIVNQPGCAQLGYTRDEMLKLNVKDIIPDFKQETYDDVWSRVVPGQPLPLNGHHMRKDGTRFPVEMRNGLIELDGRKLMLCLAHDVTERLRQEEALRQSEERYALAAEGANDGLFDWNVKTQEIYYSPRWKAMLGLKAEEISSSVKEWFKRLHPDDFDGVQDELDAHLSGKSGHFQKEYRILHRDGSYRWMLARAVAVRDSNNTVSRLVGSQTDITSRKTAELQVIHDAFHDILTGMPNRALFIDRLGQAMQRSLRNPDHRYAVLFLAIDRFDIVNDSLGHKSGDRLLMDIAHRLTKVVRPGDTVARLGGAEFAILSDDIGSPAYAEEEAARIQQELSHPFSVAGQEVFVSASIGIALDSPTYTHAEEVLRDADTAMRRAKELGNRNLVFNSGMHTKVVSVLQLGTDLRWAVERQEFVLHYQPIIDLQTGHMVGLEALIRWQKPNTGMVSPAEFIPLAEENGLIVPMTWWVLKEACRQMRDWKNSGKCNGLKYMNVNLSSKMFMQPNLVARIKSILDEFGIEPSTLKLEITESALMEYTDSAAAAFDQLKALNISLVLDDFGTGYSSLSYLHRFPLDVLKIDRSFVSYMGTGTGNTEIVRTIVTLAQNLKMESVAEGVETPLQSERLKGLNCRYAQGYLYSKPISGEKITELLATQPRW
ncbi:MAG TPA: EAL domain-containing protein, partial [Planctomycetota bacterium]|nr:EAL domain-containing protein [Planctomycetota bacterium]